MENWYQRALKEERTLRMASGYADDFSKSNNAWDAEQQGRYPASKIATMLKVPVWFIKEHAPKSGEWHHTSKMYNVTEYYDLESVAEWLNSPEGQTALQSFNTKVQNEQSQPVEKITGINIRYLVWGGTRNHPRASTVEEKNVTIERKPGQKFLTITTVDGKSFKKALETRGFEIQDATGVFKDAWLVFDKLVRLQSGITTTSARISRKQQMIVYYQKLAKQQFPSMPDREAQWLAEYLSETKGVMQSEEMSSEEAMCKAVRAFIRHQHTDYDAGFREGLDRDAGRELYGKQVDVIYNQWRTGYQEPPELNEPLHPIEYPCLLTYTKLDGSRNTKEFPSLARLQAALEKAKQENPNHKFDEIIATK